MSRTWDYAALSEFWHRRRDVPIAMMGLYCDESDDGHTYALAGWLAVPTAWCTFDAAWRAMLSDIAMPDGSSCPEFHAAEIVNRDCISDSRFKGWGFGQERDAFIRAVDLLRNRSVCPILWPVGCAVELPAGRYSAIQRDAVWVLLFLKVFQIIVQRYPAQQSISFMFDEKPEVKKYADAGYSKARELLRSHNPHQLASTIAFGGSGDHPPLQAADLLVYEWRKSITDRRQRPEKPTRTSWNRIRSGRSDGYLWRYSREFFESRAASDGERLLSVIEADPCASD